MFIPGTLFFPPQTFVEIRHPLNPPDLITLLKKTDLTIIL